jgi:hypothetical protein
MFQGFVSREVTTYTVPSNQDMGQPAAKVAKVDPVKVTTKRTATFVPLQDALDVDWSSEPYVTRLSKADSSYFLMTGKVKFIEFRSGRLSYH